ncbi:MAG TPA: response regulator transcription factor [Candidatus Acidoferrales bacterium]
MTLRAAPAENHLSRSTREIDYEAMAIRILIVDDSTSFREVLRVLLEDHADWDVCGEAADGVEGLEKNRLLKPDVIIMDQSMPRMSGTEAAQEILKEFPQASILLLTLYLTKQLAEEARRIGIRGTFSKTATGQVIGIIDQLPLDGASRASI